MRVARTTDVCGFHCVGRFQAYARSVTVTVYTSAVIAAYLMVKVRHPPWQLVIG